MKPKLPTIKDLAALVRAVKRDIQDEYRVYLEDDVPGIQLTIGWSPEDSEWGFLTGDNSHMSSVYHYPVWAVQGVYRRSNSREVARDLIAELAEQVWEDYSC